MTEDKAAVLKKRRLQRQGGRTGSGVDGERRRASSASVAASAGGSGLVSGVSRVSGARRVGFDIDLGGDRSITRNAGGGFEGGGEREITSGDRRGGGGGGGDCGGGFSVGFLVEFFAVAVAFASAFRSDAAYSAFLGSSLSAVRNARVAPSKSRSPTLCEEVLFYCDLYCIFLWSSVGSVGSVERETKLGMWRGVRARERKRTTTRAPRLRCALSV